MTTTLHDRIATRAYFAWLDAGEPAGQHETHWLAAEAFEVAEAQYAAARDTHDAARAKRSAAALKAAATRRANREAAATIGAEIAALALAKPARSRRVTAH